MTEYLRDIPARNPFHERAEVHLAMPKIKIAGLNRAIHGTERQLK